MIFVVALKIFLINFPKFTNNNRIVKLIYKLMNFGH